MRKPYQHRTAADIISKLALHKQLDASQAMIVKITPVWLQWANQKQGIQEPAEHQRVKPEQGIQDQVKHQRVKHQRVKQEQGTRLSSACINNTLLLNAQQGKLVIRCDNAVNASQIKHQQNSLLSHLHNHGFEEIQRITIRVQHPTHNQLDHGSKRYDSKLNEAVTAASLMNSGSVEKTTVRTSEKSLEAIEYCQKMATNDHLANSLSKLAKTLKDLS